MPCCSARADVGAAYPGYPTAGASWQAPSPLTVVRLGRATFVDRFDLSGATVELVGDEVILHDVVIRDQATQVTETVTLHWRWVPARQGLGLVHSAPAE